MIAGLHATANAPLFGVQSVYMGSGEMMSALTSSIGQELGQPLGAIVSNAKALQMVVTANRAQETIDVHAVINETLGLVVHNMNMRQVETRVDLSSNATIPKAARHLP